MELQQVLQEKYYKSSTQIGSLTETKINSVNCLDLFEFCHWLYCLIVQLNTYYLIV